MSNRSHEVDVIRSFALLGICVVNLPFLALSLDALMQPPAGPADWAARLGVEFLFQGKFFVLFSFLFGWGFGVQLAAAERHGAEAWPRYRMRLLGLFLIGVAHATLVFGGDILMLYALLGLLLWPLRGWSVRRLVRSAVMAQVVAAFALMAMAIFFGMMAKTPPPDPVGPGYLGGFIDAARQRLADLPVFLTVVVLFNGPTAFACFCAGLAAFRSGFFELGSPGFAWLQRAVPWLVAVGLVANAAFVAAINEWLGDGLGALFGVGAMAVGGPALGAVYIWGAVTLWRRLAPGRWVGSAGRMSLSAYVAQGILAGLVFNGYGLALYGRLGDAWLLAIALGIVATVHLMSHLWLRVFAQGPLELLLRGFMRHFSPGPPRAGPTAP